MKRIKNNECASICAKCGGKCCKRMPGAYTPDQFGLIEDQDEHNADILAKMFNDPKAPYKLEMDIGRPSEVNFFGECDPLSQEELDRWDWCEGFSIIPTTSPYHYHVVMAFYECPYNTEQGCRLSFEERPTMCKALSPSEEGCCISEISLRELSKAWEPFQGIILTLNGLLQCREDNCWKSIWKKYVPEDTLTKELILEYLPISGDLVGKDIKERKAAEKKRKAEEDERLKQESNPLYLALKGAGF